MTHTHEGPRTWQRWLNRWWVVGPLVFIVLVGVRLLLDQDRGMLPALVNGAIYGTVAGALVAWRQRKDGRALGLGPDRVHDLDRRIRKEDVPEDPEERRSMAVLVRLREEQLRSAGRWAFPVMGVCLALVAGLLLALGAVVPAVIVLAVGAAFVPVALWNRRRLFDRFARLTQRLDADPKPGPDEGEDRGEDVGAVTGPPADTRTGLGSAHRPV
ncbi:hypothetical protein [Streptomyces niveus]|uniref:hypothetical protein n=1 Tax=Streptomyces niveus TaxID=193462 RepID=UPI00344F9D5C